MTGAALAWSTGGVLLRHVSISDGWEIVFWRSLFMVPCVALFLLCFYRQRTLRSVLEIGWPGWAAAACLASQFFFFILSVQLTTVAEALTILSTAPFFAAILGGLVLRETIPVRTMAAMTAAFAGIATLLIGAPGSGSLLGNVIALGVPVAFAVQVVLLRYAGTTAETLPTVLIAGLMALVVAFPLSLPLTATNSDLLVIAVMAVFQIALGCVLMMLAVPHLTAAEVALLALLEPALGPCWVWLILGERPGNLALLSAAIVLTAVFCDALLGLRHARR
jgi:drug/metabolite transporter (DMT)-like permease